MNYFVITEQLSLFLHYVYWHINSDMVHHVLLACVPVCLSVCLYVFLI